MGKYLQSTITTKESIVCEGKQHWIALLPRGIIAALFFLSGLSDFSAMIGCIFIILLLMTGPLIRFLTTELGFTNKRLIGKMGLINTKSLDSPLNKINNISTSSGLFGKILGYGNISITTSSGSYMYKGVASPEAFKTALMKQIDQFDEDRIKKQASEMANAMRANQ